MIVNHNQYMKSNESVFRYTVYKKNMKKDTDA